VLNALYEGIRHACRDGLFTLRSCLAGLAILLNSLAVALFEAMVEFDSIFASGEMMAKYASKRAGIGLEIGTCLSGSSCVGEIMHTGTILKNMVWRFAVVHKEELEMLRRLVLLSIWHHQFDDQLCSKVSRNRVRVRHMDYGVVTLQLFFWRRFKNKENITFFGSGFDLYEAFDKNTELFEELYVKYEKQKGLRKKTMMSKKYSRVVY